MRRNIWRDVAIFLFISWIAFVLWMTLIREPRDSRIFRIEVLWAVRGLISGEVWGKQETICWAENFLLFIPFGFLFPKKSLKHVAITALALSMIIELIQFVFLLGECELDDVIANTIGAIIGSFLFTAIKKLCEKHRR